MKITFIGSGGEVEAKGSKYVATMVECGDAIYLVDGGCAIADELLRLNKAFQNVRALFVTHYHGDHTAGIFPFVDLINWAYKDCALKLVFPTSEFIEATKSMILASLSYGGKVDNERLDFILAHTGRMYEDENILVDFFPTKHFKNGDTPSYAILITERASGKKALFSGDLSYGLKGDDIPKEALLQSDVFVTELYHFTVPELIPHIKDFKGMLCINHLFERDKFKADIKAELSKYNFRVLLPENHDAIEI